MIMLPRHDSNLPARFTIRQRGSILVIVLWIAFGLVSVALYFGNTMSFELKASDNSAASAEASQAIDGAARYAIYLLSSLQEPGVLPDARSYQNEEVPIGESTFWFLGREDRQVSRETPSFGLIDEASKLNLNTATSNMLELLPGMTPQLAAAIIDWRDPNDEVSSNGAESETYSRLRPSYRCKNARFETIEELRFVFGADPEILNGEDLNRNGALDLNENDGDTSEPSDNRDGRLDPGILDYVTVYSREPNKRSDGSARINVTSNDRQQLRTLLEEKVGQQRAGEIIGRIGQGGNMRSLLEFFIRSGMTQEEFAMISADITVTNGEYQEGLINVNSASEAVLACIPGIGLERAGSLVSYRQSNSSVTNSIAWVAQVLDETNAVQAGPYLTSRSYQVTADVAALSRHGRGYRRTKFVIDTSEGAPKIIHRRDLTEVGWALGNEVRQKQLLTRNIK